MEEVRYYAIPLNYSEEVDSDEEFKSEASKLGFVWTKGEILEALLNGGLAGLYIKIA